MSASSELKAKLGLDVFKPAGKSHITIKPGTEKDSRLKRMVRACPAGLYTEGEGGAVVLTIDGCLDAEPAGSSAGPTSWNGITRRGERGCSSATDNRLRCRYVYVYSELYTIIRLEGDDLWNLS